MVSPSIEPGKDPGKAKITGTVPAKPEQLAAMTVTGSTSCSYYSVIMMFTIMLQQCTSLWEL